MSEKRFTYKNNKVYDNLTGEFHSSNMVSVNVLNEQQATINKLQDENEQLREINKELGDDLHNCRLNKNIISEKLKLWQDTLAEYDIYTIKDLGKIFELDAKINKEKGI